MNAYRGDVVDAFSQSLRFQRTFLYLIFDRSQQCGGIIYYRIRDRSPETRGVPATGDPSVRGVGVQPLAFFIGYLAEPG